MRTDYCGLIDTRFLGQTVTLFGWVHRRRDHGGVIFIDLRDREGLVQVVVDPDTPATFGVADRLRNEYVVKVEGRVRPRPEGTVNPNLASGAVEVLAKHIELLNASLTPPFQLDDENLSENVRLEYRVIDLRRPQMQRNLRLRYQVAMAVRRYLDAQGFIDIETPMLTKSTPEGARDFLVPSRMHAGQFYALPQSPQLFKQLLMIAGFDRYYQITKCFRDEDLRADRQPEFTQIDIETSFLGVAEITALMEAMIRSVFKEVMGIELPNPFPRMSYAEAMSKYGSDKPDLRVPLTLTELTDVMREVEFKVFSSAANLAGGRVAALRVPGGGGLTRSEIDGLRPVRRASTAPRGSPTSRSTRSRKGREGLQSPDREEPVRRRAQGHRRAHRGERRRPHLLRRGQGQGGQRRARARCAPRSGTRRASWRRAGGRCGCSTSPCSSGTTRTSAGTRCTTRSPRRWTATRSISTAIRARPCPRPTTWC